MRQRVKPRDTRVYDEQGERVIADLPPGLYFHLTWVGVLVRIDRYRRARVYPFVPGGGRKEGRTYRGGVAGLARAAFERYFRHYLRLHVPDPAKATDGFEEAVAVTPWAYGVWGERPCG